MEDGEKLDEKEKIEEKESTANLEEMAGLDLDVNLHTLSGKEEYEESEKGQEDLSTGKEKEEDKKSKPPEITPKEKELEDRVNRLERDKNDLKKALHESRQERKKTKESEVQATLTDADLMKIVEEHKDDPKVMFNALGYKMQQMLKSGKTDAVNEVEIKNKQRTLNAVLKERIKGLEDEGGEPREIINRAKIDFVLEDHPLGDFLATAAAVYADLPNIAKSWFDEGKKAALNEKVEELRKDGIKKTQLTPAGSKILAAKPKDEGLTTDQLDTARKLGITTPEKLKIYKSQILKGSATNA